MENEKKNTGWFAVAAVFIAGACLIACTVILVGGFLSYKNRKTGDGITATGSASCDFEADLAVWRGSFSSYGLSTGEAYQSLNHDSEMVRQFLLDNGIQESEMVFSSVTISNHYESLYNDEGNYQGDELIGYDLYQEVYITSNDVNLVDQVSRDISGLIESGVSFYSDSPEYYYTKLDELKLNLIEEATKNAKERVDIMSENSGSHLGNLLSSSLGVFQITAQNSAEEEYSYGGTFNTSSRYKTATITVRLNYEAK